MKCNAENRLMRMAIRNRMMTNFINISNIVLDKSDHYKTHTEFSPVLIALAGNLS